jgi:phosphohistidine phosphatase SixA
VILKSLFSSSMASIQLNFKSPMLKKTACIATLLLMAACSSGSKTNETTQEQSSSTASKEQPVISSNEVEDYEVNDTTVSGEQRNANFINQLGAKDLASALRDGGHVIYIRHAKTNKDWGDQVSPDLDLTDCSTQRQLSSEGKAEAKQIGEGIKSANIPVGEVISSEYCRAYNTADLAFGKYTKNEKLNFLPCVECTPEDYKEYAARVSPLLSAKPKDGTNTFLVGHDDPFQGVTMTVEPPNGIYPAPMGVSYVVKPMENGKFELVARVLPSQWDVLADN